jgi:hypothetical protein
MSGKYRVQADCPRCEAKEVFEGDDAARLDVLAHWWVLKHLQETGGLPDGHQGQITPEKAAERPPGSG